MARFHLPLPRRRWLRWLVILGALAVLGGVTAAAGLWYFSQDLPDVQAVRDYHPSQATQVYGQDNALIG